MKRALGVLFGVCCVVAVGFWVMGKNRGPVDPKSGMPLLDPGEYHTAVLPNGQPPWLAHVPGRLYPFLVCMNGARIEANPTGKIITTPGESMLAIPEFDASDYPVYWIGDFDKAAVYRCADGVQLWNR